MCRFRPPATAFRQRPAVWRAAPRPLCVGLHISAIGECGLVAILCRVARFGRRGVSFGGRIVLWCAEWPMKIVAGGELVGNWRGIGGRLGFPLLLWRSLRAGLHVLTVEGCCLSVESCDCTKNGRWMHRGALGGASHTRKHTAMDEADLRFMRRVPRTRTRCRALALGERVGVAAGRGARVCRSPRSVLEGALCRHGRRVLAERGESSNIEPVRHAESRALACA